MWAQLITMRLKAGTDEDLPKLFNQLKDAEQQDSGLLRTLTMRDQNDPGCIYTLVLFESEDKARAREQDGRRQGALAGVRATMAEILDGPPTFVDLTVVNDVAP